MNPQKALPTARLTVTTLLATALLLTPLAGCGGLQSYVESEDAALGRVVVYRNGIAYFERKAEVDGDRLVMRVPRDRVDDFLKSLTVADAITGHPYPVSFPTRAATRDGNVDMVIQLPKKGSWKLVLSYITDAPAWKPSYRLMVGNDGTVDVQGWAIVDNTSGEDWKSVRLGVGSSSALSFRYDLRTVRTVHRETLHQNQRFAAAPPMGGSSHRVGTTHDQRVIGSLADREIPRPADHPDRATVVATAEARPMPVRMDDMVVSRTSSNRKRRPRVARVRRRGASKTKAPIVLGQQQVARPQAAKRPPQKHTYGNERRVKELAAQLQNDKSVVVIEGFAKRGEREAERRGLDRANLLRNRLIKEGVAPAQLRVKSRGYVSGAKAGVRLVAEEGDSSQTAGGKDNVNGDGAPVGESHFESQNTITVKQGTSAMVSILDGKAKGEVVYLYDAEAERGNARFAFKAVRFINPTDSTLEPGPVTVYGQDRFIGEGLSTPIPPRATAFVPFALDRQVVVETEGSTGDQISRLVSLSRGVLTAEVQHHRKKRLTVTNRSAVPVRVFVRHTVRKGWELTRAPKGGLRLGTAHLFEVALKAGETQRIEIEEATPLSRTVDLHTDSALDMVRVYLKVGKPGKRLAEQMRGLVNQHQGIADIREQILSTRQRMEEYRERVDELQMQLINLARVRGGGQRLTRHLKSKMVDISNRLQRATIAVVDLQQKLTLAQIEFQDAIAELTLDTTVSKTAAR